MFYLSFKCWLKSDGEQDLGWLDLRNFLDLPSSLRNAGLADTAAVIGLFNANDRVAGPLETEKREGDADFRAALGRDRFDVGARA